MSIDKKLDELQEDMTEVKVHLAKYNTLLDIHIRRTEALEYRVEPIEDHIKAIHTLMKLGPVLIGVAAFIYYVIGVLSH